ncbi:ATP-binding protein [Roseateles cellulosilyticus]|uniref:Helix-turn-helix transcriptional regulator n=1 Tax=Pelomonas cellulosilytica TaxID=2906762 RepID=A0ABS8Y115_9BURK|nr:winged helix-turn-helix domain-containing protein [Pelomonas sp. P8]MCE4555420.1 helix-turn-helix transcriptional regulator [Pelomonas sp. P8]
MKSTPPSPPPLQLKAETADAPLRHEYRFGDFLLRPAERQLLLAGETVAITARAFDVLVLLVQRSGHLVTKDQLMQQVWGGVVVEDNNIAVQVAQLRKLVGARAIATISGVGYRFTLTPEAIDADARAQEAAPAPVELPPGNLPARAPALIGRDDEMTRLTALLSEHPLVTLVGAAGVGKTHLAMAAARHRAAHHPDGVFWVELAPLTDPAQVAPLLLRVLGIKPGAADEPLEELRRKLRAARLLVVLDNAEHLVGEVERVAEALVRDTERLSLLITSQVPLRTPAQQIFRLGPLALPDEGATVEQVQRSGAVQLLAQRAAGSGSALQWDAASAVIASGICRELDGNALAIELAAARLPSLGIAGLAARLHQRLGLLSPSSHPSRRNALAVAFDWSHGLLSDAEQRVFRWLSVFPGSFDLDAAASCLADDTMTTTRVVEIILDLVDRSLVTQDRANAPRYRLLETARLFAQDKLEASGEARAARQAFMRGIRRLFEQSFDEHWQLPTRSWAARWAPEIDNLRAAIDLALEADAETAIALYGTGWPLWLTLLQHAEARSRGELLSHRLGPQTPSPVAARFWEGVTRANSTEYPQHARTTAERAARLYAELGDARGQYMAWAEYAFNWRVDHPQARRAMALAKAVEDPRWPSNILSRGRTTEATLELTAGRTTEARELLQSVLDLCRRDGDVEGELRAGVNLADVERAAGELDRSVARSETLLPLIPKDGSSPAEFSVLGNLIGALVAQGNLARAKEIVAECARRQRRLASDNLWCALDALALLHALEQRWQTAGQLAGAADRAYRDRGQEHRQPNEVADRERLDRLLAAQVDGNQLARWKSEGDALDVSQVWQLALSIGGDAQS